MLYKTFKVSLQFTALLSCCFRTSGENTKAHADSEIDITQAPWLVSLRYIKLFPDRQYYCTGVILGPNEILSVAHCYAGRTVHLLQIRAGSNDMYNFGLVHHEDLRQTKFVDSKSEVYRDFAFIRVKEPFKFEKRVQPIVLAVRPPKYEQEVEIVGWKKVRPKAPPVIVRINFTVWSNNECNATSKDDTICIGGINWNKVKRKNEAGNSVLYDQKLIGLVLGVISKDEIQKPQINFNTSVSRKQATIVYHSIIPYSDWISKKFNASRARAQAEGLHDLKK